MIANETVANTGVEQGHKVLVTCVGNPYRQDDGVGLLVASLLEAESPDNEVEVQRQSGDGVSLLEAWQGASDVVLVDAARTGALPGTVYRVQVSARPVCSTLFPYSTHAFGAAEAIEMARVLGTLPSRLVIYAIEGAEYGSGTEISPQVEEAAQRVARSVLAYAHAGPLQPAKS